LLAQVKASPSGIAFTIGLHCAVLFALVYHVKPEATQTKIARVALTSISTISRSLSVTPTLAQDSPKTKPQLRMSKPIQSQLSKGPVSSPVQTNETLAAAAKPTVIDLTKDAAAPKSEPSVRLLADLMLPDAAVPDNLDSLKVRIWLNEAGQCSQVELINLAEDDEQFHLLRHYLLNAMYLPFVVNGQTVAGVGILELKRGGLSESASSPVVTPDLTAER
jgi:hypothetical protein